MKVTVIPIVNGALKCSPDAWLRRLEELEIGQAESIQTTALLSRPEYRKDYWRPEETCCYSDLSEGPSANAGVKNSPEV